MIFRWFAFGNPAVHHIDVPWYATRPGGEARHEALCHLTSVIIEIEPDGTRRCLTCRRLLLAC